MSELTERLSHQLPEPDNRICFGTLLSRQQFLFDVDHSATLTHASVPMAR